MTFFPDFGNIKPMLNVLLIGMHKEHWLLSFSPELARNLKTTIFKIGKPNYRFSKTALGCHFSRSSWQAKHPRISSAERLRGASSGKFSFRFTTFIIYCQSLNGQQIFLTRVSWRVRIKQTDISLTDSWLQIKIKKIVSSL